MLKRCNMQKTGLLKQTDICGLRESKDCVCASVAELKQDDCVLRGMPNA